MDKERLNEINRNTLCGIFDRSNSNIDKTLTVFCKEKEALPLLVDFVAIETD